MPPAPTPPHPRRRAPYVALGVAVAAVAAALGVVSYQRAQERSLAEASLIGFGVDRTAPDAPSAPAAPAIELVGLDGSRFSLASLRGKVVFVNFWATWCPPCREEMPSMLRLARDLEARYPGKFKMVAVSVDEDLAAVRAYFGAPPFAGLPKELTIAHDPDQAVTKAYYCTARGTCPDLKFPETYIVDKAGRLVAYVVGPRDWDHPGARLFLEALLRS